MSYKTWTVAKAIGELNRTLFLPALQREFVWKERQITRLFDSIMRGYPISSFLFWKPRGAAARKWPCYSFLDEVRDGGTHNRLANITGKDWLIYVLDGQQRLTALAIGLQGWYETKEKGKWKSNPHAWKKKKLYLDLLHQNTRTEAGDDDVTDVQYRFTFWEEPPPPTNRTYWFEVGRILRCKQTPAVRRCARKIIGDLPQRAGKAARAKILKTLQILRDAVFNKPAVSFHQEMKPDYDRVLDIFVRANEAGTRLTKSDLLLSTVTANWGENAREAVHQFVDSLNGLDGIRNELTQDFVIKSCFVLCDLPVKYRITSFTRDNLATLETKWPAVKLALEDTVRLTNRFGLNAENLTSVNALIPLAYYIFVQQQRMNRRVTFLDSERWQARNAALMREWLLACLLRQVFSGSSDTMLAALREVLKSRASRRSANFPTAQLNAAILQRSKSATFDDAAIDQLLTLEFGDPNVFLLLSLLSKDRSWGVIPHEVDHIFPKSHFTPEGLTRAKFSEETHGHLGELCNQIGNLQLLSDRENNDKRAKEFHRWIKTRSAGFKKSHMIPTGIGPYSLASFETFVGEREKLLRRQLKALFVR